MQLVEHFLTKNPYYKAGIEMQVKGLILHSVGCPQPNASVFLNAWDDGDYYRACVHAVIDGNDGTVYQTLPWNYRGAHCGGNGNASYIGVEMCEPSVIEYISGAKFICTDFAAAKATVKRTYQSALEVFAYLCKRYRLNSLADGVVLGHSEAYARGIASNHGDPQHLWNGLNMGYSMDGFRKAVAEKMQDLMTESEGSSLGNEDICSYQVKVQIPNLNIRKGPGTNYAKTGKYTGVGTFTIVEEASGQGASKWGRLKSGAGWIALDFAENYPKRVQFD